MYLSDDALFDSGDQRLASVWHAGALDPGADYTSSAEITIGPTAPGRRHLLIVADDSDFVNEGDAEANNVRSIPVLLRAPDLAVSELSAPSTAWPGQAIMAQWTVANEGDGNSGPT